MDAQAIDIDLDHTGQDDPDDGAGEPFDTDIAAIPNLGAYRLIADDFEYPKKNAALLTFPLAAFRGITI